MQRVVCPGCHRRGFAHSEKETRGTTTAVSFTCQRCGHEWKPKPTTIKAVLERERLRVKSR